MRTTGCCLHQDLRPLQITAEISQPSALLNRPSPDGVMDTPDPVLLKRSPGWVNVQRHFVGQEQSPAVGQRRAGSTLHIPGTAQSSALAAAGRRQSS